jgi:hypothetical protein
MGHNLGLQDIPHISSGMYELLLIWEVMHENVNCTLHQSVKSIDSNFFHFNYLLGFKDGGIVYPGEARLQKKQPVVELTI